MRRDRRLGMLPDPFVFRDGHRVRDTGEWEARRREILEDAVGLEYDGMPPEPEVFRVEATHRRGRGETSSYRIHCGTHGTPFSFCFYVYRSALEGRRPVVLTGDLTYTANCSDAVIAEANRRGFTVVKFNRNELAPDYADPERRYGINALWPARRFSAVSAWSWGYHRIVDALAELDDLDTDHIAITGHSRGGKAVLLAGATDPRIRYTNPNGSGTHGCGAYRFEQVEEEGQGFQDTKSEPLAFMMENIGYWMGQGLWKYVGKEETLPHDSHFIKALIAPRCYLETNGYDDIWANPRGSYLSWEAAREVWKLYGAADRCACWYRPGGHGHRGKDFNALFDFMEADLSGTPLPDEFTRIPYDDMEPLYEWSAPKPD